jgi:pimeloyl-ACP methyl ester carboxylesterase
MKHLLFLHGALGTSAIFDDLIAELQDEYVCHCIDLPMHGNNSEEIIFEMQYFVDYLLMHMVKHFTTKVTVFGYSMGGYIALAAAAKKPEYFQSVFTFSTKFTWNADIAAKEASMLNPANMLEKIPRFVQHLQQIHHVLPWEEIVLRTASLLKHLGNQPLLRPDVLQSILVPVLLGVGDKNKMVSTEETMLAASSIPNSHYYVLPNTKHVFEDTNKKIVASIIRAFANE